MVSQTGLDSQGSHYKQVGERVSVVSWEQQKPTSLPDAHMNTITCNTCVNIIQTSGSSGLLYLEKCWRPEEWMVNPLGGTKTNKKA